MAWTYVNGNSYESSSSTDVVLSKPTGTAEDDILFALVVDGLTSAPTSAPSGWTKLAENINSGILDYCAVYYKMAGASEPSTYTWTWASADSCSGQITTWRGSFDTADPIDSFSNTAYTISNTTVRAASFTVASDSSPVIFFGAAYTGPTQSTYTPPSGFTERLDTGAGVSYFYLETADNILSSGSTGVLDATLSNSTTSKHAFAVSLNPLIDDVDSLFMGGGF